METWEQLSILLVDDDPVVIRLMSAILKDFAPLRFATSGSDALRLAQQSIPDLMFLDVEMPGMTGYELCNVFRQSPLLSSVPIVFLTAHSTREAEYQAQRLGASEFITKPPHPQLVLSCVRGYQRTKNMVDTVRGVSLIDFVTSAPTRRGLKQTLAAEWKRAQRNAEPLAILLAGIDDFSQYNERHGEQHGDMCLRGVAKVLREVVRRPADLLARYGGSSFALLLPDTPASGAFSVARRACHGDGACVLPEVAGEAAHVTLSMGISCNYVPCDAEFIASTSGHCAVSKEASSEDMLEAAEHALRMARRQGGQQVLFQALDRAESPRRVSLI